MYVHKIVKTETLQLPDVSYEDIGGLKKEIDMIREMVEVPMKHPEVFQKWGVGAPKGVLLTGPPGTGKTILAKAITSILPPPSFEEALEIISIQSAVNSLSNLNFGVERPFRSPHHTSSYSAVVGGGAWPKPGEVTLAHRGVLFLDEFPEFERRVIESLRQPLEDGFITISRVKDTIKFPAQIMLIAAMNPCPCGNLGLKKKVCVCNSSSIFRYQRKISGPITDRIDLWTEVNQIDHQMLSEKSKGEKSADVQKRVINAREIQRQRFQKFGIFTNSEMSIKELDNLINLSQPAKTTLNQIASRMDLSPRSYHRVIKIARTIADLDKEDEIKESHIAEALQYRPKQSGGF